MTDDCGFGAPSTFGGVIPTPALDRIAKDGPALHAVPFHGAVLADARGPDHRTQPPRGRLWRRRRGGDRVPGLRLGHPEGVRHDRHDPEGERLRDLVVRQGPQHALLPGEPGRAVRPMARSAWASTTSTASSAATPASGSRTCSATRPPSIPFEGNPGWNLTTAMADDAIEYMKQLKRDRTRQAVLCLLRARRHARAASSDAGVDQEDQRHAPVRRRLEQAPRDDLRQPEAAGHHPRQRQADAVAEGSAGVGFAAVGTRRSSSSSRPTSTAPTSRTPTTRSAG